MAGNLYQLMTDALAGQYVIIGGTYDTYGQVQFVRKDGFRLIRGLGHQKPPNAKRFANTETIE